MKKLIFIFLVLISSIAEAQYMKDHIDRSKAVNRFNNNKNLKITRTAIQDVILQFVYDSTNHELYKITEIDLYHPDVENEYCFNSEQLYYSKTNVGINYFFDRDFSFTNAITGERINNNREKIIARSYRCLLAFKNYVTGNQG